MGESRPHGFCQMLAFGVFILVIEKNIGLVSLVPAVHMHEDSSFVGVFILLEQGVYLVTSLFQAANLVERDRTAHAGFPFAVFQVFIVPYTVFGILDDNVDFGSFCHQVACQTEYDVVGIFVFVQLDFANPSDCSRIRASVSADQIETGSFQFGRCYFIGGQFFTEQRFIVRSFGGG